MIGANAIYIDINYGGTLIIYDRLFGTFQAELDTEPVVYGTTHNVNSWDPLWCNLHHWSYMWKLSKRLSGMHVTMCYVYMQTDICDPHSTSD